MSGEALVMWSIDSIKSIFGDYICRRCINHMFDAGLTREDCTYGYVYRCPCCGKKLELTAPSKKDHPEIMGVSKS